MHGRIRNIFQIYGCIWVRVVPPSRRAGSDVLVRFSGVPTREGLNGALILLSRCFCSTSLIDACPLAPRATCRGIYTARNTQPDLEGHASKRGQQLATSKSGPIAKYRNFSLAHPPLFFRRWGIGGTLLVRAHLERPLNIFCDSD